MYVLSHGRDPSTQLSGACNQSSVNTVESRGEAMGGYVPEQQKNSLGKLHELVGGGCGEWA